MGRWILMAVLTFFLGLCVEPLFMLRQGINARVPGRFESRLMRVAKHKILVGDRQQRNPLVVSPDALADGKAAFSHYCLACHGMDGQNTGVPFADRMSPPVPSLASAEIQSYTDGQLKWVIENGIWPSGMPASRGMLSDAEIWSIVIYLRHLPAAGSAGEPEMYSR
jgi:S-disulfanyl-L-cysteine oxidoreductase SoxD